MNILRRAVTDTFRHFSGLIFAVLGGALSLLVLYVGWGRDMAVGEVPYFLTGALGALGMLLLLFVWNLAASPYRTSKERAEKAEAELKHWKPAPRPPLPAAEAEAISASAIELGDLLQTLGPPLVQSAWNIYAKWERHELTFETKVQFAEQLAALSEDIHAASKRLAAAESSNARFKDFGFSFVFTENGTLTNFKQRVDGYHNAVRELGPGQSSEILRMPSDWMVEDAQRYLRWIEQAVKFLQLVSRDPSKHYGLRPER